MAVLSPASDPHALAPELRNAASLPSAMLLAVAGGGLDAFVYLNHGHVFAAAMTGNAVFLGIALLAHNWPHALLHVLPIISFIAGILASHLLTSHLGRRAARVGLVGELAVLLVLSWFPAGFPEPLFVALLAFAAAYQVASFRTVDTYAFNSTFITGNLRLAIDGLYDALTPSKRPAGLRQARDLGLIIASFVTGSLLGSLLAPRFGNRTLWFAMLPLAAVLLIAERRLRDTLSGQKQTR